MLKRRMPIKRVYGRVCRIINSFGRPAYMLILPDGTKRPATKTEIAYAKRLGKGIPIEP